MRTRACALCYVGAALSAGLYLADVEKVVGAAKHLLVLVAQLCLDKGLHHERCVPELQEQEKGYAEAC